MILPTLGPERRATYSPILPIHPVSGQVMQVVIEATDPAAGTVTWMDEAGERFTTPVTGGACKLQWKADWAMRWFALGVDYEMSGKDLIDSVRLSGRICQVLGAPPPVGFTYELFLDEHSQKISKSKGNGLSVDEWLRYAPPESLGQFMYHQPQRAKRLFFDVIPRAVDDYIASVAKGGDDPANPAWHIGGGRIPNEGGSPIPFTMLLNLASVVNAETRRTCCGASSAATTRAPGRSSTPFLARLVDYAVAYYRDFVRTAKRFRPADGGGGRGPGRSGRHPGRHADADSTPEAIQDEVYAVGKRHPFPALKNWFECLYQVLLGQQEGPRFGGFVALYGIPGDRGADPHPPSPDRRKRLEARTSATSPPCLGVAAAVRRDLRRAAGVPPPQAGRHQGLAGAIPRTALVISFAWTVLSYGVLTFYDRLGTIYAGHKVRYRRVAFASFCAYALSHNLGFAAVSGAAVRYRLYSHWGLTPVQIAKVVGFCSLTFGLGGLVLGGCILFVRADVHPVLQQIRAALGVPHHRRDHVDGGGRLR